MPFRPGWIEARFGFGRGFDVFWRHADAAEADAHLAHVIPRLERPFFVFLHLFDVHSTQIRPPFTRFYDPPDPFDPVFLPDVDERLVDVDIRAVRHHKQTLTREQYEAFVALYDGGVRYVDAMLERWLEDLRARGLLDRTLVVVTADHGDALGQRGGEIRGHGGLFEEALHVPLMLRFPDGYRAGERSDALVHHVDVLPTWLEYAGLGPDERLPGYSLLGEVPADRVVRAQMPPHYATLQGSRKILGKRGLGRRAFDLAADSLELRPAHYGSAAFEALDAAMTRRFDEELARTGSFRTMPIRAEEMDAEQAAELRALGYLGGSEPPPGER